MKEKYIEYCGACCQHYNIHSGHICSEDWCGKIIKGENNV